MSEFLSDIVLTPVRYGDFWMLDAPLVYRSDLLGDDIVIPAGFVYDGNSLPRLFWIVSYPMTFPRAAAIHDYGYRFHDWPKAVCDALYREALQVEGAGALRRFLRYWGVRLFGRWAYQKGDGRADHL